MNAPEKNLFRLDVKTSELFEARIADVREMAYLLFRESKKPMEPLDIDQLRNIKKAYARMREDAVWSGIGENEEFLKALHLHVDNAELSELALALKEFAEENGAPLLPSLCDPAEIVPKDAARKVALMQNMYTDTAFSRFSPFLKDPSPVYYDSFRTLCEDAGAGRCEYCIVPIENSDDGKLMSFYKLLAQNDLKIALTTRVSFSDDAKSTTFALAKKGMDDPTNATEKKGERYFELCLVADGGEIISDICGAARLFGIRLHRIDSFALTYSENEFEYYVVLDVSRGDMTAYLIYLSLKLGYFDPVGLYTKIN